MFKDEKEILVGLDELADNIKEFYASLRNEFFKKIPESMFSLPFMMTIHSSILLNILVGEMMHLNEYSLSSGNSKKIIIDLLISGLRSVLEKELK